MQAELIRQFWGKWSQVLTFTCSWQKKNINFISISRNPIINLLLMLRQQSAFVMWALVLIRKIFFFASICFFTADLSCHFETFDSPDYRKGAMISIATQTMGCRIYFQLTQCFLPATILNKKEFVIKNSTQPNERRKHNKFFLSSEVINF